MVGTSRPDGPLFAKRRDTFLPFRGDEIWLLAMKVDFDPIGVRQEEPRWQKS